MRKEVVIKPIVFLHKDEKRDGWVIEYNGKTERFKDREKARKRKLVIEKKIKEEVSKKHEENKTEFVVAKKNSKGVNDAHSEELKAKVFEMILDGLGMEEVTSVLINDFGFLHDNACAFYYSVKKSISEIAIKNDSSVLAQHIERYEWLYRKMRELKAELWGVKMLQFKEKLLGLHKDDVELTINNFDETENNIYISKINKLKGKDLEKVKNIIGKIERRRG